MLSGQGMERLGKHDQALGSMPDVEEHTICAGVSISKMCVFAWRLTPLGYICLDR